MSWFELNLISKLNYPVKLSIFLDCQEPEQDRLGIQPEQDTIAYLVHAYHMDKISEV